jgi:hypothetical protein
MFASPVLSTPQPKPNPGRQAQDSGNTIRPKEELGEVTAT